jgi:SAM-dependent methyltransferase
MSPDRPFPRRDERAPADTRKVFANLGCGPSHDGARPCVFEGWREVRVDIEPKVEPDIIADLTDLSPIASESMDGVWCSHCLEHLPQHEAPFALSEMRRILVPGGVLVILVPDLQSVASLIVADRMHETLYQSPAGPITPHDIVFGFGKDIARGLSFMAHRSGFTPTSMMDCLRKGGFEDFALLRRPTWELAAVAAKDGWASTRERDDLLELLGR